MITEGTAGVCACLQRWRWWIRRRSRRWRLRRSPPRESWKHGPADGYRDVHALVDCGWAVTEIVRELRLGRNTVTTFARAERVEDLLAHVAGRRPSVLHPYREYLRQRWDQGCRSATALRRELAERGLDRSFRLSADDADQGRVLCAGAAIAVTLRVPATSKRPLALDVAQDHPHGAQGRRSGCDRWPCTRRTIPRGRGGGEEDELPQAVTLNVRLSPRTRSRHRFGADVPVPARTIPADAGST